LFRLGPAEGKDVGKEGWVYPKISKCSHPVSYLACLQQSWLKFNPDFPEGGCSADIWSSAEYVQGSQLIELQAVLACEAPCYHLVFMLLHVVIN
jgi:hypothetical protein